MGKANILTGSRALLYIGENPVGLFANCSWSIGQEKVPAYILGRYNPAEITPTSQEPVQLTLTGYRVIGSGPYAVANATELQNLLNEEDFSLMIFDRRDPDVPIFAAVGCRVMGWSSGVAARGVSDIRVEVIGIKGGDESSMEQEDVGAASLTTNI